MPTVPWHMMRVFNGSISRGPSPLPLAIKRGNCTLWSQTIKEPPEKCLLIKGWSVKRAPSIHGVKWRFDSLTTVEPAMPQIIPNAIFVLRGNMKTAKRGCITTAFGTMIKTAGSLFHQIR